MNEFWQALTDPNTPMVRYALFAGLIASVSFGVVGSFVVARRISYIAAAIAHSILGGIGAAVFLQRTFEWPWCTPLLGSVAAALVSALVIGMVSLKAEEREDSIIGAIWAAGMASGILFLFFAPGPAVNAESYLFGDILVTSGADLIMTAILGALVVGVTVIYYPKLVAVCFDDEFVKLRGLNASAYYLLLLCIVGLSIVLLVRLTGIILAIALIVLPAATATRLSCQIWKIMIIASVLSMLYTAGGLTLSYLAEMPTGPVVVLAAAIVYTAAIVLLPSRRAAK